MTEFTQEELDNTQYLLEVYKKKNESRYKKQRTIRT